MGGMGGVWGHDWLLGGVVGALETICAARGVRKDQEGGRGESALQVNIGWLHHMTRGLNLE